MQWFDVAFGIAGLTQVGYRQYNSAGGDAAARTGAGVVEIGGGAYGALVEIHANAVGIQWDTGEGEIIYANESFTVANMNTLIQELHTLARLERGNPITATKTSVTSQDGSIEIVLEGNGKTSSVASRV